MPHSFVLFTMRLWKRCRNPVVHNSPRSVRLLSLQLTQFRNYPALDLALGEGNVHLFVGKNGAGKTNLLDAINVLSLQQSFLCLEEQDLVLCDADFYRIRGSVRADAGTEEMLEVVSQIRPRKQKACFQNDVRRTVMDFVGSLPSIAFLPQDLELFTGAPAMRRRFLDQVLTQVSPRYERSQSEYQKILKQRNSLLKRIAGGSASIRDLAPWDAGLAEKGAILTIARLELIETFSLTLRDELHALGEVWKEASLQYERTGKMREEKKLATEMESLLHHAHDRDVLLQATTVGPHRDDWHIEVDGVPLERYASRGQQRTAVLSLLFLEASYLELRRNEKPVILLDDVFSELDDAHQDHVVRAFPGHQVLMTSTREPPRLRGAVLWQVKDGVITQ